MVLIKEVSSKKILDSRKDSTILVSIKTLKGKRFSASSPTGKSIGKYETKTYKKNLEEDIKTIKKFSDYFSEEINSFNDLEKIEEVISGNVGANTFFAFESAVLKALAFERKKEIWQLINPNAKKFPRLVGNCVGGGKHSITLKKPDFQEFLLVPNLKPVKDQFEINKKSKKEAEFFLKKIDENFKSKKNDEEAWETSLNEKEVLETLKILGQNLGATKSQAVPMHRNMNKDFIGFKNNIFQIGIDVAASSFYKRKKYNYKNPLLKRDNDEQFEYISNLIKNFDLFYIEDPFEENDFKSFAKLLKRFPSKLIVGDNLTITNLERLEQAIKNKSISGIIIKPNQNGSLLEIKKICEFSKENKIKIIFSHRSGETEENILADLAFGFQADFFKVGITGKEREVKINRLIEIERSLE